MKKVIIVNASPRPQGNCSTAINIVKETIKDADIEYINLADFKLNDCNGCGGCKAHDTLWCSQQDEMTALLEKVDKCDALLIATPIYFGAVAGRAKIFLDRLYPFYTAKNEAFSIASKFDKKIGVIATANLMPVDVFQRPIEFYTSMYKTAGFTDAKTLVFNSEKVGAMGPIFSREEDAAQVKELANWLVA